MILKKKTLDSRVACVLAETILEEHLPINLEIGRCSGGMTDVLFSFEPEDEVVYLQLIDNLLETLYSL